MSGWFAVSQWTCVLEVRDSDILWAELPDILSEVSKSFSSLRLGGFRTVVSLRGLSKKGQDVRRRLYIPAPWRRVGFLMFERSKSVLPKSSDSNLEPPDCRSGVLRYKQISVVNVHLHLIFRSWMWRSVIDTWPAVSVQFFPSIFFFAHVTYVPRRILLLRFGYEVRKVSHSYVVCLYLCFDFVLFFCTPVKAR
jgi:hypothetical protein